MSASSVLSRGRRDDYRDVVLVAGTNPYAYKGLEDLSRPGARPDREGGSDA